MTIGNEQSNTKRFLSTFRGETQTSVIEFGKRLWEQEADVFIFMARKAACFFEALRELKLADVRGLAVSDRVLDMDTKFLKGKRVTLVDDCIFTGTSIYNARNAVMQAGAKECNTISLAINKDWLRSELLPGNIESEDLCLQEPIILLDDAQSVQQCYDIVRAISLFPRPYDVDFPHTKNAKISSRDLKDLLEVPGWSTGEISTDYQLKNGVRVFTLISEEPNLEEVFSSTLNKIDLISIAKIRIYCRKISNETWSVRLVPMAVLNAIRESDIKPKAEIWRESEVLLSELGFISAKSRYRLLQYLLALRILENFCTVLMRTKGVSIPPDIRDDLAEMTFGPKLYGNIDTLKNHLSHALLPGSTLEPKAHALVGFPVETIEIEDFYSLAQECIAPFLWLYRELEIPARELVKTHGLKNVTDSECKEVTRLGRGFSSKALIERLTCESINVRRYVSFFLDQLIDQGVAVPTIVEDNNVLYRAFRHGEDAVFGEAEERLCTQALRAYMEKRGIDEIYGLELQKFIVLFVQIALQQEDLIERLDTSQGIDVGCRIISIKGHLHGPVPTTFALDKSGNVGTPYITGNDYPFEWVSLNWVKRGFLINPSSSEHYFSKSDIKDPLKFFKYIFSDNTEKSKALRSRIQWKTSVQPSEETDFDITQEDIEEILISGINSALANENLAISKAFRSTKFRSITKTAIKKSVRNASYILSNRLIIEDAYPQHFHHSHGGEKYRLGTLPSLAIGNRKEAAARRIGRTLGSLVGTGSKPLNNEKDLVLLSTCTDADYQVRALSGELAIVKERWITSIDQVRDLVRKKDYSTAQEVLREVNQLYTAVHSGCMKYKWFVKDRIHEVLAKTKQYATSQDPSGALLDDWQSLWPDSIHSMRANVPQALSTHIHKIGYQMLLARLTLALLDLWIFSRAEEANQKTKRKRSNLHNECLKYFSELNSMNGNTGGDAFSQILLGKVFSKEIEDRESLARLCKSSTDLVESLRVSEYSSLLSDSRVFTERYGSIEELQAYPYAINFEVFDPNTGYYCQNSSRKLLYQFCLSDSKIIDSEHNPWRRGAWIVLKGNVNSTLAAEMLMKLLENCRKSGTKYRAVLIGQLPYSECIREMKNSEKFADGNFFSRISNINAMFQSTQEDCSVFIISENRGDGTPEYQKYSDASRTLPTTIETAVSHSSELPDLNLHIAKFTAHTTFQSSLTMTSSTISLSEFKNSTRTVEVGIITIREDEYEAISKRLPSTFIVESDSAYYSVCSVPIEGGLSINVAIVRCLEQGESSAQAIATNFINDFDPTWLIAVGIGGSIPNADSTLGDVLISSRVHDLSVNAISEEGPTTYQDMGSPVTVPVEKLLSSLRTFSQRFSNWNEPKSLGLSCPTISPMHSIDDQRLYGADDWKKGVLKNIQNYFPEGSASRKPIFATTPVITTNSLIKDTRVASDMSASARHASAVEMEIGGIMKAARYRKTNVFTIRGISDIIGLKRDRAWTAFACESAASFANALVRSGLIK